MADAADRPHREHGQRLAPVRRLPEEGDDAADDNRSGKRRKNECGRRGVAGRDLAGRDLLERVAGRCREGQQRGPLERRRAGLLDDQHPAEADGDRRPAEQADRLAEQGAGERHDDERRDEENRRGLAEGQRLEPGEKEKGRGQQQQRTGGLEPDMAGAQAAREGPAEDQRKQQGLRGVAAPDDHDEVDLPGQPFRDRVHADEAEHGEQEQRRRGRKILRRSEGGDRRPVGAGGAFMAGAVDHGTARRTSAIRSCGRGARRQLAAPPGPVANGRIRKSLYLHAGVPAANTDGSLRTARTRAAATPSRYAFRPGRRPSRSSGRRAARGETMSEAANDYVIADISLAEFGEK